MVHTCPSIIIKSIQCLTKHINSGIMNCEHQGVVIYPGPDTINLFSNRFKIQVQSKLVILKVNNGHIIVIF